ncbi:nitroreductase family protein [Leifsonia poae]|uniref:Nitroreductase n=1 Tax=Leifsonia poae TaxID=110933 RepID=A0A9W6HC15_9MICO|nr:nitroreductase family protein [Leifsonia poae]GLJ77298.1 nitroreductase [Leifsonia poae]
MSLADLSTRTADTTAQLLPALAERWSPRSYDAAAVIDEEKLNAALEAARWSPSAANTQPWRFIVARRGTPAFDAIVANLLGFNATWAGSAGALIVALAEVIDPEGNERRWANYDLGQAVAHLTIQAHHDGLHAHQMGGFDAQGLREAFDIDERFVPVSVTTLGTVGDPDALPDRLRERELAPRTRVALDDILVVNA